MKSLRMFSMSLLLLSACLASDVVSADQCQLIPSEQMSKALDHIKPNSQYVRFCEPCGDKNFYQQSVQTVESLRVSQEAFDDEVLWELFLNDRSIDLAYIFVRTAEGSFLNLSKLADCPSSDVSMGFPVEE